jgi:hypothetical protein
MCFLFAIKMLFNAGAEEALISSMSILESLLHKFIANKAIIMNGICPEKNQSEREMLRVKF